MSCRVLCAACCLRPCTYIMYVHVHGIIKCISPHCWHCMRMRKANARTLHDNYVVVVQYHAQVDNSHADFHARKEEKRC
jgi:hypothetical protein